MDAATRCIVFQRPKNEVQMTRVIKEAKKRRSQWLLLLPVLAFVVAAMALAGVATSANTHPALGTFTTSTDQLGANDVPGQKDLTLQGTNNTDEANGNLWVVWNWDDTSVSGGNTLDACTLFDSDADGNANLAVCLTLQKSGNTVVMKSNIPIVYTCGDARNDRCSSQIAPVNAQGSYCEIETNQAGPFDAADTQAFCLIKITALGFSSSTALLNTCSYPSQQPNSDPSDCVLIPGAVNSSVSTTPSSSWSVTLNDSATVTPSSATGSVTFNLYAPGDTTCATPIWSASASLSSGSASTSGLAGSPSGGNTISAAGTYHWKAVYGGVSGINGSDSGCGEAQTVTAPVS
jgi:hypothetical protein